MDWPTAILGCVALLSAAAFASVLVLRGSRQRDAVVMELLARVDRMDTTARAAAGVAQMPDRMRFK